MSYRFKVGESVADAAKRVVEEQLDKAVTALREAEDLPASIHDVRKRLKKARATLRLIRPGLKKKTFKRENCCYRDAGRALSDLRDAAVLIDTLADLKTHYEDQIYEQAFKGVHKTLNAELAERRKEFKKQAVHEQVAVTLEAAKLRVEAWDIDDKDWNTLEGGLAKSYKGGKKSYLRAFDKPSDKRFHTWRKYVKDLWYHERLLREVWPSVMKARSQASCKLADLLGDDHDLAVLRAALLENPERFRDSTAVEALLGLLTQRSGQLRFETEPLAKRIYAESTDAFVSRIGCYYKSLWFSEEKHSTV